MSFPLLVMLHDMWLCWLRPPQVHTHQPHCLWVQDLRRPHMAWPLPAQGCRPCCSWWKSTLRDLSKDTEQVLAARWLSIPTLDSLTGVPQTSPHTMSQRLSSASLPRWAEDQASLGGTNRGCHASRMHDTPACLSVQSDGLNCPVHLWKVPLSQVSHSARCLLQPFVAHFYLVYPSPNAPVSLFPVPRAVVGT